MTVTCPKCGEVLEVDRRDAERAVNCSACGAEIVYAENRIYSGKIVAGFELQDLLGLGGMGEVWLAYQKSMDRRVAVKILSPFLANDAAFVENFLREVKLAAKLDHPNIVSAFDAGFEDGIYYLAMTYVPGETFYARVLREKQLPESEILSAAFHVGKALQYAWDKLHIIHRDVNPANIMLTPDGDIKLMDMGISKSMAEDDGAPEEHLLGTPNYISPEQIQGKETLDVRSDMYSLGATLYHLATGLVPFDSEDTYKVLDRQVSEKLTPVREINSAISHPCSVLIENIMEKNRDKRPASWDELLADIQCVIKGEYPRTSSNSQSSATDAAAKPDRKQMKVSSDHLKEMHDGQIERLIHGSGKRSLLLPLFILLIMVGLSAVLALQLLKKQERKQAELNTPVAERVANANNSETNIEEQVLSNSEMLLQSYKESWEYAVKFAREHPDKNKQAIRYFLNIKKFAQGTKYALMADSEILKIRKRENVAVEEAMQALHDKAAPYINNEDYFAAAKVYGNFTGELAEKTAAQRDRLKRKYIVAAEQLAEKKQQEKLSNQRDLDTFLTDIAGNLCEGDLAEILRKCQAFEQRPVSAHAKETVNTIRKHITELANVDTLILKSFAEDAGKTVSITISGRRGPVRIQKVLSKTIYAEVKKGMGFAQFTFTLRQLTIEERYARLEGRINPVPRALYAGIYYFRRSLFDMASPFFEDSGVFAAPLAERIKTDLAGLKESKVRSDFAKLLGVMGISTTPSGVNRDDIQSQLIRSRISALNAQTLQGRLSDLMASADDSTFVEENRDGLNSLCETLAAIAAGETGNTISSTADRPNAIDEHRFYKPIKEARRTQGRILSCDPLGRGRNIIPELVGEEINHNMVLVLKKGDYQNRAIVINKINDITIECEEGVEHCTVTLNKSDDVNLRGVSLTSLVARGSGFVMVDSYCHSMTTEGGSGIIHNSRIKNLICRDDLMIDHCHLGSVAARNNRKLYIRNSIIYAKNLIQKSGISSSYPCFRFYKYLTEPIKATIKLRNCIVFTDGILGGIYMSDYRFVRPEQPVGTARKFFRISEMDQFLDAANCLFADPQFVNAEDHDYRLKSTSPAKNASMSGRDLGASPDLKPISL